MSRTHATAIATLGFLALAMGGGGDPSLVFERGAPLPDVRVQGIYDPSTAVRLQQPAGYVVPPKKVLLMTSLASFQGGPASVDILNFWPNGASETFSVNTLPSDPVVRFPSPGILVPAGAAFWTGTTPGVISGYLLDAPGERPKAHSTAPESPSVRVVGIPGDTRDFVYIRSIPADPNFSYRVPAGKKLIVTAFGSSTDFTWASIRHYRSTVQYADSTPGKLFYEVPAPGIPFAGGTIVNPVAESTVAPFTARAIGYLIDE
jgi:hypothetical protein